MPSCLQIFFNKYRPYVGITMNRQGGLPAFILHEIVASLAPVFYKFSTVPFQFFDQLS